MMPHVSIIIPTFDRAAFLATAVDSALAQDYPSLDVIIVDDGSTDETADVVAPYLKKEHVSVVRHQQNEGVLAAKNTGFDHADGTWIGILDSDDQLLPGAVRLLVETAGRLRPAQQLGTIIGNCVSSVDGSLTGKGVEGDCYLEYEDFLCGRVTGEFWGLVRREVLGRRRFDERFRGGFERMLWLQLYRDSATYYLDVPVRRHERGAGGRVTSIEEILAHAAWIAGCYAGLLQVHGPEMLAACPSRFAYYLRRQAFFEMLSGRRIPALLQAARALRVAPNAEALGLLIAGALLPRSLVAGFGRRRAVTAR